MSTYVFGYGSLCHRGSLAKGLARAVTDDDLRPAFLTGFRRVWGASELVRCESRPGIDLSARFLDLVPDDLGRVNGAAIRVTEAELESLKIREKSYATYDVSGRVSGLSSDDRCFAFASAPSTVFTGEVVLFEYVRLVEEGFSALGAVHLADFRRLTAAVTHPLLEGRYRFVDPEQNARTSRAEERVA